jgi:hypothetical protein
LRFERFAKAEVAASRSSLLVFFAILRDEFHVRSSISFHVMALFLPHIQQDIIDLLV